MRYTQSRGSTGRLLLRAVQRRLLLCARRRELLPDERLLRDRRRELAHLGCGAAGWDAIKCP